MMKTIAALLCAVLAAPASALELSLEENRAERGSVGYVDMNRLFAGSPDAQRAKENFEELVRQAEEEVNTRRAALVRLRQEVDALKAERETVARSTPTITAPAPKAPATPEPIKAAAKPEPAKTAPAAVEPLKVAAAEPVKPAPRRVLSLPGFDGPSSTMSAVSVTAEPPPTINLPGVTTGQDLAPTVEASPVAAPEPEPVAAAPEPVPAAAPPAVDPSVARLIELDGLIAARLNEIGPLEASLEREQTLAERNLLDAESRRTDQVLARLYRAIGDVARRDGVSVVVDKSAILYGHPAVDLTDRVLAHLRGPKQ